MSETPDPGPGNTFMEDAALTRRDLNAIGLMLALGLVMPEIARAQEKWTVTVTPGVNPLPIGSCSAVALTVFDPKIRDRPRDPRGTLISMADFDMTVTSPDGKSVVGQYLDQYHWSVCGCQGAAIGAVGTITAKYPGQLLTASNQVPHVTSETIVTFLLAKPAGAWNPPGCPAPPPAGVIVGGIPVTPKAQSAPVAPAPAPPPPPAPTTVTALSTTPTVPVIAPASASSAATGTQTSTQPAVPLADQSMSTRTPVTAVVAGPAPTGVTVKGNPAQATVAWQPTPGVSGYSVVRWKQSDPNCCRAQSPVLPASATSWDDLVQWTGTWIYRVTALYPNSAQGFADASYLYPEPQIPVGFKAEQTGEGTVALTWQPVANASYYVVAGPPTNQAMRVNGASATVTGVPEGNQSWQVGSMYDPDGVHRAGSASASTSLNVVRRSGRYRLLVETIRVDQQTGDPDADGHGDEVYVSAFVQTLDRRTGALLQSASLRSAIHGDVIYWPAPARVARGSASNMGGLKTGDVIPVVGQMGTAGWSDFVLWEGLLTDGVDEILVAPMLWESDDETQGFQSWKYLVAKAIPTMLGHPAVVAEATASGFTPVVAWDFLQDYGLSWTNMDRPLGLKKIRWFTQGVIALGDFKINMNDVPMLTAWDQWVVVLTREKIEASLAATTTFGGREPGVIPVVFTDASFPIGPGNYTVYLRVVRLP